MMHSIELRRLLLSLLGWENDSFTAPGVRVRPSASRASFRAINFNFPLIVFLNLVCVNHRTYLRIRTWQVY